MFPTLPRRRMQIRTLLSSKLTSRTSSKERYSRSTRQRKSSSKEESRKPECGFARCARHLRGGDVFTVAGPTAFGRQWLPGLAEVDARADHAAAPRDAPRAMERSREPAGWTQFVLSELVPGTLREGFARLTAFSEPVARALMIMIIVSEVHPFMDGNGRTARLATNSTLSAANRCRIIVPTSSRSDYLMSLKALSGNAEPK